MCQALEAQQRLLQPSSFPNGAHILLGGTGMDKAPGTVLKAREE